jgi:hypothetical protein
VAGRSVAVEGQEWYLVFQLLEVGMGAGARRYLFLGFRVQLIYQSWGEVGRFRWRSRAAAPDGVVLCGETPVSAHRLHLHACFHTGRSSQKAARDSLGFCVATPTSASLPSRMLPGNGDSPLALSILSQDYFSMACID